LPALASLVAHQAPICLVIRIFPAHGHTCLRLAVLISYAKEYVVIRPHLQDRLTTVPRFQTSVDGTSGQLIFCGEMLHLLPSGALHWPTGKLLAISDLHLGKSERLARRGGALLPPYETQATLEKLDRDLNGTGAETVICLGDSFDDLAAARAIDEASRLWLTRLMAGRNWTWITGNHDPGPIDIRGTHRAEVTLCPFTFRHIAQPSEKAEISGHYHPKARLAGRSKPCFLVDATRLVMPAYGAYTGGLPVQDPALGSLMAKDALAILTGNRVLAIPMPR
jgi:uncharacterized protein